MGRRRGFLWLLDVSFTLGMTYTLNLKGRRDVKRRREDLGWEMETMQKYLDDNFSFDFKDEWESIKNEVDRLQK